METRIEIGIPLILNLVLPEGYEKKSEVELLHESDYAIALMQTPFSIGHQEELSSIFKSKIGELEDPGKIAQIRQALLVLSRTFIVPTMKLYLFNEQLDASNAIKNEHGKLEISINQISDSPWYALYLKVEAVFSTIIKAIYLEFRDPRILKLSTEVQYKYTTPLPQRFILLEQQIKSIKIDGNEYAPLSFDIKKEEEKDALREDFLRLEFSQDGFQNFLQTIKNTNPLSPRWDLQMQYILLAEEHFAFGDTRLAIIEMDIAIDLLIRSFIRSRACLKEQQFETFTKELSTGSLINVSKLFAKEEELGHISNFEELHNLRNTILHHYQRRIRRQHELIFENAKESIIAFN